MNVLVPVGAGSAPGEPSGRWVAGCCASRADIVDGDDVGHAPVPVASGADRPAHCVRGPQQRF